MHICINAESKQFRKAVTMTKRQNAKLNMYLAVLLVLNSNSIIWNVLAVFVTAFDSFKLKLQTLQRAVQRQADLIAGYAKDKRLKREAMAEQGFAIKSAIQAYAADTDNVILFDAVNYALSELMSGAANRSVTRCKNIRDLADVNKTALVAYGVTNEMLADYGKAIDDFEEVIANPRDQIGARKAATKDIKDGIAAVDAVLKDKLDKLMENFRLSAPEFYAQYYNDRKIFDAKTNYTEIRVLLLNKETGAKLEGVVMKAKGETKEYSVLSNSNGIADAKQITPEVYDLEFELPGFEKVLKSNIDMSPGEKEEITIEMVPVV
ncbi:MAG TPA: carboxypeptidase-like regulatory domain-containing protein [Bacteroidia bacterium]|nr:carboxypeptidase-like regulatory domain-containing protein [Bacteroidia bacterium]